MTPSPEEQIKPVKAWAVADTQGEIVDVGFNRLDLQILFGFTGAKIIEVEIRPSETIMTKEEAIQKYDQVIVMLNRELDEHIDDPDGLLLPRSAWEEAVRRVEAIRAAMKAEKGKEESE